MHQDALMKCQERLKEYEDIDKIIQKLSENQMRYKNFYYRTLAQVNVEIPFKNMGVNIAPKQSEEIVKIYEMHGPKVVEIICLLYKKLLVKIQH